MARSNRALTQFAIRKIEQFLTKGPAGFYPETQGNTEVEFHQCPQSGCMLKTLRVKLFGEIILSLILNPTNPRVPSGFVLFDGNFHDSLGRPSRTTRERLNGILDRLGEIGFLPEGVRAFVDKETGECRVGKDGEFKPFGRESKAVVLLSDPDHLVFS